MANRPASFTVATDGSAYVVVNRHVPDSGEIYPAVVRYPVGDADIEITPVDVELEIQQIALDPSGGFILLGMVPEQVQSVNWDLVLER